jgi:hypothetical protein
LLLSFKSPAPYICKENRDVENVPTHNLSLEEASIKNVRILLDMDNVVDETFAIPLLQLELSIHSFYPWNYLFVSPRDQKRI